MPIIDADISTGGAKTFDVTLSNPKGDNATIAAGTAVVTITDDDAPPSGVTITSATVLEPLAGQTDETFTVSLSSPVASPVTVQYITESGTATSGTDFTPESGTIVFPANHLTEEISIPINTTFVQKPTETFEVLLSNPTNGAQLVSSEAVGTIVSQTVTTVTIDTAHPFRYRDASGHVAVISLHGPGTGTLSYLGQLSDDTKQLVLDDTTAQSQLAVSTTGGKTALVNLIVNGDIGSINAAAVNLLGNLQVTGAVQTLRLDDVSAGNAISIGAPSGKIQAVSAVLGSVIDTSFTSALPIAQLKVTSWSNTAGSAGISAPSAKSIVATAGFQANVSIAGSLTAFRVGKALTDSVVDVGGVLDTVQAGTMAGDTIFAGVTPGLTTLPTTAAQFSSTAAAIEQVVVTSNATGAFADTRVSAPTIGSVQFGSAASANGGTQFGIAASSIRTVRGSVNHAAVRLTAAGLATTPFSDGDLLIHLIA